MREIIEIVFQLIGFGCCIALAIACCEFVMYIVRAVGVWAGILDDNIEYEPWEE